MSWGWLGNAVDSVGDTLGGIYDGASEWASNNIGDYLDNVVGGSTQDTTGASDTAQPMTTPPQSAPAINQYWLIGGGIALALIILLLIFKGK